MTPTIPPPKFNLIRQHIQQGDICAFARADNGMIIGAAQNGDVAWGEDGATCVRRQFVDHEHAVKWLKERCRELCGREDVDFFDMPNDAKIIVPRGPLPKVRM